VTIAEWLAARRPRPPGALRARIEAELASSLGEDASLATDRLLEAGERMAQLLLRSGSTSRESALDLLAADALVTYAFEAASEAPADLVARATDAMRRIARAGVEIDARVSPTIAVAAEGTAPLTR
jgi:hypothetical protein